MAYVLPEGEEDDELDAEDFDERMVLSNVVLDLHVELNETEHGYCDCDGIEAQHPNVSKRRVERGITIAVKKLADKRHESEKYADKAVLEYAYPNDLGQSA
jgi:hypothetical protein